MIGRRVVTGRLRQRERLTPPALLQHATVCACALLVTKLRSPPWLCDLLLALEPKLSFRADVKVNKQRSLYWLEGVPE